MRFFILIHPKMGHGTDPVRHQFLALRKGQRNYKTTALVNHGCNDFKVKFAIMKLDIKKHCNLFFIMKNFKCMKMVEKLYNEPHISIVWKTVNILP